jgi:hypothetical protein
MTDITLHSFRNYFSMHHTNCGHRKKCTEGRQDSTQTFPFPAYCYTPLTYVNKSKSPVYSEGFDSFEQNGYRQLQGDILKTLEWDTYQFEGCGRFNP